MTVGECLLSLAIDFGFTSLLRQSPTILCYMVAPSVFPAVEIPVLGVLLLELRLAIGLVLIRRWIERD